MGKDDYVQVPLYDAESLSVDPVKPAKKALSGVPPASGRGRGCSKCCKTILIALAVVLFVVFAFFCVAVTVSYRFIADKVEVITVTEPRVLPVVVLPEAELQMVKDRITLFVDDLAAQRVPPQDLIITEDEVNGLIAASDFMRGNFFVHLEENKVTFETSLPMSKTFLPGGKGRYFVSSTVLAAKTASGGDDTLAVDIDAPVEDFNHGKLVTGLLRFGMDDDNQHPHVLNLVYGKAFGKEPCEDFYKNNYNLIDFDDDDDDDNDFIHFVDGIATIAMENGKIVVKARRPTDDSEVDAKSPTDGYETATSRLSPWNLLRRLF